MWQLAFSSILLGRRYSFNQMAGCLLVAVGIVVAVARYAICSTLFLAVGVLTFQSRVGCDNSAMMSLRLKYNIYFFHLFYFLGYGVHIPLFSRNLPINGHFVCSCKIVATKIYLIFKLLKRK